MSPVTGFGSCVTGFGSCVGGVPVGGKLELGVGGFGTMIVFGVPVGRVPIVTSSLKTIRISSSPPPTGLASASMSSGGNLTSASLLTPIPAPSRTGIITNRTNKLKNLGDIGIGMRLKGEREVRGFRTLKSKRRLVKWREKLTREAYVRSLRRDCRRYALTEFEF